MFFQQKILNSVFELCPPDYAESRRDKYLWIWKDIPHWMVLDDQMQRFLRSLKGRDSLKQLFAAQEIRKTEQKELIGVIQKLTTQGVLKNAAAKQSVVLSGDHLYEIVPIENIALNLTKKCNLRCQYCYNLDRLTSQESDELSSTEIIQFLKTIKPLLSKQVSLAILGGEPLLFPKKLLEIADFAVKNNIVPMVSTNGTMIDRCFAREAKRLGLEIQISLDSHSSTLCNALRGSGVFEKIRENMKILTEEGVYTILSMVCYEQNLPYIEDYFQLAASWKADEARFIPLKKLGGAQSTNLRPAAHFDIIQTVVALLEKHPEYRRLLGRDCLSILANTCRFSNKRNSCGTGLQTFLLDSDGCLYPCLNTNRPDFSFGCIRDSSFDFNKIWHDSMILVQIRQAASIENHSRVCHSCIVKYWCLGGCRGETCAVTGKLDAPSNHCKDLKMTLIEIFWILAEKSDIIATKA